MIARRPLLGAPAMVLAGGARAQAPVTLSLATATPGGGFPAYGAAFAAAVHAADPGLTIEPRNTAGSLENVNLLAEGRVDLGLVAGETATAALAAGRGVTLLFAMYAQPGLFGLRGDSPVRSIAELRGQRIAWGARGSGFVVLARQVTTALGLDMERDFQGVLLDRAGDGPTMVMEGRVAALWGGGAGWPGFVTLARGPQGLRFVAPDAVERARILAADPTLRPMSLPAGSYQGQTEAVDSVGTWSLILARPGLEEEVGYRLAAALHKARGDLGQRLAQASETTAENTVSAVTDPALIQPGVRRFLRGLGLLG
ncbi:TAXI family TRAP transporter solute-binding subunit [Sediminicoccus sp. BL-A-41-H5]|uniref:TAXI family TRAP transporter solute-binding subunit n=1 Tax=Sediminicoccus sp. BL-A-41-H5 TaxID=3421106 RepID=UPI003D675E0B